MKSLPSLKTLCLAVGFAALGSLSASAQTSGSPDPAFSTGTGPDGQVRCLALQGDGKVVIGGLFGMVGDAPRIGVARLNANGSLDTGFNPGTGINGGATNSGVYAVAVQADGKVLVGGVFDAFNDAPHEGIVRLNPDGSVDAGFNAGTEPGDGIRSMAVQPDGKIVLVGDFLVVDGATRRGAARLNPDGSLDAGFDAGGLTGPDGNVIFQVALQPDGKLLVCGNYNDGVHTPDLTRLNANGSVDGSFDPSIASGEVEAVAVQADGKVVIGGTFSRLSDSTGDSFRQGIARLNTNGSVDKTFPGSLGLSFQDFFDTKAIAIQADGRIIFGGRSLDDTAGPVGIGRLNADGSVDSTYAVGKGTNSGTVYGLAIQADNNAVVGGGFVAIGDSTENYVARVIGGPLAPTPTPNPTASTVSIVAKSTKLGETSGKDKVIVTRSGDTSTDLTVAYSAKGSAAAGVNYKKLAGTVVIPAGSASAAIKVKLQDDHVRDGTLVLKLTLLPGDGYTVGSPGKAKIKILNAD